MNNTMQLESRVRLRSEYLFIRDAEKITVSNKAYCVVHVQVVGYHFVFIFLFIYFFFLLFFVCVCFLFLFVLFLSFFSYHIILYAEFCAKWPGKFNRRVLR